MPCGKGSASQGLKPEEQLQEEFSMPQQEEESEDPATPSQLAWTHAEQVDAFTIELWQLLTRYRHEFDLTLESYIGILHCLIAELAQPEIWDMGSDMLEDDDTEGKS